MIKYSFFEKKWRVWIFNMVYLLHAKQQHFHFPSFVNIISIMCMQQNFTTYFLVHNLNVKWGKQRRSIHTWIWSVFSSVFLLQILNFSSVERLFHARHYLVLLKTLLHFGWKNLLKYHASIFLNYNKFPVLINNWFKFFIIL